ISKNLEFLMVEDYKRKTNQEVLYSIRFPRLVHSDEDGLCLDMHMPGMDSRHVSVCVEDNTLLCESTRPDGNWRYTSVNLMIYHRTRSIQDLQPAGIVGDFSVIDGHLGNDDLLEANEISYSARIRGSKGSAPCGVKGQRPLRGQGAEPLAAFCARTGTYIGWMSLPKKMYMQTDVKATMKEEWRSNSVVFPPIHTSVALQKRRGYVFPTDSKTMASQQHALMLQQ
ncbi:zinc finger, CCHC-type containing protein, partial [Tanacetum coccineum]